MSSPIFVWAWAHPISQTRAAASGLNASSRRTTPRSRNAPLIPCGARVRTAIPSTELPPPGCSSSHAAMSAPRSAAWSGRHAPSLQCSQLLLPRRTVRPLRHRSARVGPPSLDDRLRGLRRTARGWTSHDRVRMKPAQCRRFPWKSGARPAAPPTDGHSRRREARQAWLCCAPRTDAPGRVTMRSTTSSPPRGSTLYRCRPGSAICWRSRAHFGGDRTAPGRR